MAKKKKTTRKKSSATANGAGKHLVIVESPAKAKTINKYLGPEYVVQASVGHVRDLPNRNPKGVKWPFPGVDVENNFEPHYEVVTGKKKVMTDLKRLAKNAERIWFATDLDREGEAITWHLADELGIDPTTAHRVVFNAITRAEITRAFENPHPIDMDKVNAQQARRVLDRIFGYGVSPLLWKKVASKLSAGRVQSVAVRLIVEREREIEAFVPDESWRITARMALKPEDAATLGPAWAAFRANVDDKGKGPTIKKQNAWLAEHAAFRAELVSLDGEKFNLGTNADEAADLTGRVEAAAEAVGLVDIDAHAEEDPKGKGPARWKRTITGTVDPSVRYTVKSIETKRTTSRPPGPFITSTLQMAASSALGFGAQRTMRAAQKLYEGVNVPGEGQVGLITYMRTDSTHLSGEALKMARTYIEKTHGSKYLPEKPNFFGSTNKAAQEAHEAIRPTDAFRHPDQLDRSLGEDERRLYRLIWNRFVACQMTPAQWDSTTVLLERSDRPTGAVFKTNGRVLVFDGFYRVAGVPTSSDEQTLPAFTERHETAPFAIKPEQLFSSPPPRYTEASLVKTLEQEGIGRPSTYASIIQVIQNRNYVEQIDRRFHATALGEVVTDKLIEAFPRELDLGFTREMEAELDKIADEHLDWREMIAAFYAPFSQALEHAHETMTHAKAEMTPAPYKCPECSARTCYRFGKNGRFLSCSTYPECDYAAPIDREGRPLLAERVNVRCPEDGSEMELRSGRFGKFLASVNYPDVKFVVNLDRKGGIKYPAQPPVLSDLECEKCGEKLNVRRGKRGPWLGCSAFPKCRGRGSWAKLDEAKQKELEIQLAQNDKDHPPIIIEDLDGNVIPEGTLVSDLTLPGGEANLEFHPEAVAELSEQPSVTHGAA